MMAGVRMGEMVVSANPTDELTALGLGSCIGLAIVDRAAGVAGLAHIVLPESHRGADRGRFADTAVPALVELMRRTGAVVRRMEAAIAGGARMFDMSGALDIGARNEQAVRAALAKARVALRATETGGNQGRTVRVSVADGVVTVRTAGQAAVTLLDATRPPRAGAAGPRSSGTHRGRAGRAGRAGRPGTSTTSAKR
jgi:chemotaxis protein CheD